MVCYRYHQGHTAKMPHSTKFLGQTAVQRSADAPNLSTGTADWPMVADANSIDEAPDLPDSAAFPIVGRSISWGHKEASSNGGRPENGNAPEQVGSTFHHRRTTTSGRECWAGAHRDVVSERRATKVLQVQRPFWLDTCPAHLILMNHDRPLNLFLSNANEGGHYSAFAEISTAISRKCLLWPRNCWRHRNASSSPPVGVLRQFHRSDHRIRRKFPSKKGNL